MVIVWILVLAHIYSQRHRVMNESFNHLYRFNGTRLSFKTYMGQIPLIKCESSLVSDIEIGVLRIGILFWDLKST